MWERIWGEPMKKVRTSAALGLFDGVHLGHRAVLKEALAQKQNGLQPCAFTFSPESAAGKGAKYIYGKAEKEHIIRDICLIEKIYSHDFADICGMDGETFAKEILCGEMNAAHVVCGKDFRFGTGASCGIDELAGFGRKYGFTVQTVDDVCLGGERVSSTEIRRFLTAGELRRANLFLGKPYMIMKEVSHGAQLGRTLGFPTANQVFESGQLVPKFGVYASRTLADGKWYPSMTNIGVKPTVEYGGAPLAETYIHGFSGDLYGRALQVVLLDFIRAEKRFASVDELREQISSDVNTAVNAL